MGVAVLAHSLAKPHLESGRLVNPFDVNLASGNAYYLVYPQGQGKDPRTAAFRDWFLSKVRDDSATTPTEMTQ